MCQFFDRHPLIILATLALLLCFVTSLIRWLARNLAPNSAAFMWLIIAGLSLRRGGDSDHDAPPPPSWPEQLLNKVREFWRQRRPPNS
jgi:hypothetical protein